MEPYGNAPVKWKEVAPVVLLKVGPVTADVCQRFVQACEHRWTNHLRPGICRGKAAEDDVKSIARLHAEHGTKWALIGKLMTPKRSENWVKSMFYHSGHEAMREARCDLLCPS